MTEQGKILVIVDAQAMREFLASLLGYEGYNDVLLVEGGFEGIERLEAEPFDLVITDLSMPDLDGYQVMEYVHENHPQTLVIVITAYGSMESVTEALRQGAFDYVTKPFEGEVMLASIERALEKIRLEKEARQKTEQIAHLFEQTQEQLAALQQAETQLLRSARMAAVGELADGVAHEINNPLTVVLGTVQLLLREPDLDTKTVSDLEKIERETQRIANIVKNFIDFARPDPAEVYSPLDVNRVLQEVLLLLDGRVAKQNIRLVKKLSPNLPPVLGHDGQLRQTFYHIIINALEAMSLIESPPTGHWLKVVTGMLPHQAVEIIIADTGCGIQKQDIARIFEAGFTTRVEKGTVRGLGMGLFIAYNVIQAHQGTIDVQSESGKGTIFRIALPVQS
jgi:two-component system NtrC family sensor kinase